MNTDQASTGPRLNDKDFFTKVIDTSRSGMEEVKESVAQRNYQLARKLFAQYIRSHLSLDRFSILSYKKGDNDFTLKYESEQIGLESEMVLSKCYMSAKYALPYIKEFNLSEQERKDFGKNLSSKSDGSIGNYEIYFSKGVLSEKLIFANEHYYALMF